MVLAIFGAATNQRIAWSDSICTALQLAEHWQDVAEDAIVGRVYLPLEDLRRFGVTVDELVPPPPATSTAAGGGPAVAPRPPAAPCWPSKRPGHGGCSATGTLDGQPEGRLCGWR